MKKIFSITAVALAVMLTAGCKKFVEGYDVSPNNPSQVSLEVLLTGTQLGTVANYTGDLGRIPSLLVQQTAGRLFQYGDFQTYDILESSIDNQWQNLYAGGLINAQQLIDQAGDANKIYRGIGRVLRAMNLGLATDMWGDIPNTQALGGLAGEANFNAAYDAQETVIRDIQSTLDAAIADLGSDPATNARVPGTDDIIFGGDAANWGFAARILKARYANRLSKRDAAGSATTTLAILDAAYLAGLAGSTSDLMAPFGDASNEWNQWFAFEQQRTGYLTMNQFFLDMLASDPRLPLYATGTDQEPIGPYYGSQNSALPLVTYFEAKFIEAEAALRAGNPMRAATAFNAAVTANVTKLGVADPGFLAAVAAEDAASITLEKIMTQKYIAMFTQSEVWSDWRRTNFPTLTPNAGASIAEIPRRFPTAQNERLYNNKAVIVSDLTQRVWWDQ